MSNTIDSAQSPEMLRMKTEGAKDAASSASQLASDAMQALSPERVLGALAEVFKALGSVSG